MYRVGSIDYPQDDDQEFEKMIDAEAHAIVLSYNDTVIMVVDTEDGEIMMLVYQQTTFTA
jgi:ribosomal protein S11